MSVFMDLNLTFTGDKEELRRLVETAAHLGYSTVAVNYVFEPDSKKKTPVPTPLPVSELLQTLPIVQGRSQPIRILNRLTIVMSDSSHYRASCPEYRHFDLLAVQPHTDKLFLSACMTYDVDLICLSVNDRLPFFYKRAPVYGAVERGVAFEVSYSAAIRDSTRRRYTLANAMFHSDVSKGKSVVVSSAAEKALELRGPHDVINLTQLFGLSDRCGRDAVTTNCRSVVLHAESRKTAGGIVRTFRRLDAPHTDESEVCRASKRARADAADGTENL
ncbi:ribonuclease P protein subunit p30 [Boleophthalmus pectinirostris]|uniref:ribonuclease P protein subunit p30 n=1 Tax=Boleophthalmus pectinirostris TaxID=150288 RepID=UPI0024310011|nr:ribonuclease P protein subunit p30 [Boleophthalmus pectinirostris]